MELNKDKDKIMDLWHKNASKFILRHSDDYL